MNLRSVCLTEEAFQSLTLESRQLLELDRQRLRGSRNARRVARRIGDEVVTVLESCPVFVTRAVLHGSYTRATNLKKPGLSDLDVVCFIGKDRYGKYLWKMDDFQNIRFSASPKIQKFVETELKKRFEYAEFICEFKGLCLQFEVKKDQRSRTPWKIDILLAFDIAMARNNNLDWKSINKEYKESKSRLNHTNSLAEYRNAFIDKILNQSAPLRILVRLIKFWNKGIVMKDHDVLESVNSSTLELLVLLLWDNYHIPRTFELNRAFATCLQAIANPHKMPYLYFESKPGDAISRPAPPTDQELTALSKKVEPNRLVIIDPFAVFNNFARNRDKGWASLQESAQRIVNSLRSRRVHPY